ncbi:MAG: peptidase S8/S53 domain-containing protein [Monoraphidium minutum]|nr:MAG: peptidase S8/S53 domain-containing protein [Monoraphidium minutum]
MEVPEDNGGATTPAAAAESGAGAAGPAASAVAPADARAATLAALARGEQQRLIVTFRVDAADVAAEAANPAAAALNAAAGAGPGAAAAAARQRLQAAVKARVMSPGGAPAARGARLARDFSALPVAVVTAGSTAAYEALASDPNVLSVAPDRRNSLQVSKSLPLINQPAAEAAGYAGAGCAVAVIDTGVMFKLAQFGSCSEPGAGGPCRVGFAKDFTAADDGAADDDGHGTNVAAIVARVAPAATILSLDVFEKRGGVQDASDSDILAALDWAIAAKRDGTFNVCAINLSLASRNETFETACGQSAFEATFAVVRAAGIVPVVAAGNHNKKNALASPACAPSAVSVGAVYTDNFGAKGWTACDDAVTAADAVTCFSNSAPHLSMLAPGAMIFAGGYSKGGTSQAAPHVAGAAAVLRAASPAHSADQVIAALRSSGVPITDAANGVTTPRLDLAAAVAALLATAPPPDTTAPTGSVTINGGDGATASLDVTLAVTGTDVSGVSDMCVSNTAAGCTTWEPFAAARAWQLAAGADGPRSVYVSLRDAKGNAMAAPAAATIEYTAPPPSPPPLPPLPPPPTGGLTINGGALFTASRAVTLAIDSRGGAAAKMCLSETAATAAACRRWVKFTATKRLSLARAPRGVRTVRAFLRDAAGAALQGAEAAITFDAAAPLMSGPEMALAAAAGQTSLALSFAQAATDADSGVASYIVVGRPGSSPPSRCSSSALAAAERAGLKSQAASSAPDGGWSAAAEASAPPIETVFAGLKPATAYAFRVCAVDGAGNVAAGVALAASTAA